MRSLFRLEEDINHALYIASHRRLLEALRDLQTLSKLEGLYIAFYQFLSPWSLAVLFNKLLLLSLR